MRILVADDEPLTNQIVSETLQKWGYDVISVEDGCSAWNLLQREDGPKLAILDWMMPGISGIDLCQRLRVQASHSYVYVILLTGKNDKVDIIEGLSAGADDYLTKPCNPQELRVRLSIGERILRMERDLLDALDDIKQLTDLEQQQQSTLTASAENINLNEHKVETLNVIQQERTEAEITRNFHPSSKWVEAHLHNILLKFNTYDQEKRLQTKPYNQV